MEAQELELKLSQIRGQIEDAKMELAEVNEAIEVLNAIKVDPDLSYPKSTSALDEIKANAESINEIATKYRTLVDSVYIIDKTVKSIRDLEYYAEWSIKNIEYKVSSVGRNTVTIDPKETTSTKAKTTTTKTSTSSSKYIDAK